MKRGKSIKILKILFEYNFTIKWPKNAIIIMAMTFHDFPCFLFSLEIDLVGMGLENIVRERQVQRQMAGAARQASFRNKLPRLGVGQTICFQKIGVKDRKS